MTKKQLREHKAGNQMRKVALLKIKNREGKCVASSLHYGFVQDGKYSKQK